MALLVTAAERNELCPPTRATTKKQQAERHPQYTVDHDMTTDTSFEEIIAKVEPRAASILAYTPLGKIGKLDHALQEDALQEGLIWLWETLVDDPAWIEKHTLYFIARNVARRGMDRIRYTGEHVRNGEFIWLDRTFSLENRPHTCPEGDIIYGQQSATGHEISTGRERYPFWTYIVELQLDLQHALKKVRGWIAGEPQLVDAFEAILDRAMLDATYRDRARTLGITYAMMTHNTDVVRRQLQLALNH